MSFQVYLQVFRHGEPAGISQGIIRQVFSGLLEELEEDYWQVNFSQNESSDLFLQFLTGSAELVHTLSIDRLSKDSRLWTAIWELLGLQGMVFHFPGIYAPLARDQGAGDAMPNSMRESLGEPVVINSASEIVEVVEDA